MGLSESSELRDWEWLAVHGSEEIHVDRDEFGHQSRMMRSNKGMEGKKYDATDKIVERLMIFL